MGIASFRRARPSSIYEHVRGNLDEDGRLVEAGRELPDEEAYAEAHFGGTGIRWAPGALEGAFSRHVASGETEQRVGDLHAAVVRLAERPGSRTRAEVRRLFRAGEVREVVDPLLERLAAYPPRHVERLYDEMRTLLLESGHREEVKFAMAILSRFGQPDDADVFRTLAAHEEFTLYAAVALANVVEDPVPEWLSLIQRVGDWGKIELVELLAQDPQPETCAYLLRHGWRDIFMTDYVALPIVQACRLDEALERERDDELLEGAAELLSALARGSGGPGGDLLDYERSAAACRAFLDRLEERPPSLSSYLAVHAIRSFFEEELEADALEKAGWDAEVRARVVDAADRYLAREEWKRLAAEGLERDEWEALEVAEKLRLPVRDYLVARLERDPLDDGIWYRFVSGADETRMAEALALADRLVLPAYEQETAAGGSELVLGIEEFPAHHPIEFLLQELPRFPGRGERVLRAALKSPAIRHRLIALRALSRWPELAPDVRAEVERLLADPEEDVRDSASTVLAGDTIPDPFLDLDDETEAEAWPDER